LCLELNAIALVRCENSENLDAMNGGVVGVFIAPTTKLAVWWRQLSNGSTVGALTGGVFWLSGGAPDKYCRLSGAPAARALTSACAGAH
jgi:hypothetical protein